MKYYIKLLCRNCKRTFEIGINEIEFKENVKANKPLTPTCVYHECVKDMGEFGVADPIAFVEDDTDEVFGH